MLNFELFIAKLNVVMLNVIMLNVIMLNVVTLRDVAPVVACSEDLTWLRMN
jgi:hypothetical protein